MVLSVAHGSSHPITVMRQTHIERKPFYRSRAWPLCLLFLALLPSAVSAQGFNEDKTALANFLKRMYATAPLDGVKVVNDYDKNYFISVVSLPNAAYPSSSARDRVAAVKARQQASTFFNGSNISSDLEVITTQENMTDTVATKVTMTERLKETSLGFVEGMELLVGFPNSDSTRTVYIFYREMIP